MAVGGKEKFLSSYFIFCFAMSLIVGVLLSSLVMISCMQILRSRMLRSGLKILGFVVWPRCRAIWLCYFIGDVWRRPLLPLDHPDHQRSLFQSSVQRVSAWLP